ncbi:MAG: anaerobic ribonucleoside-triphosphate reductase [Burkholderiales bacterium]|nr:anaerobic ribonucleoside-triphosphate reductase [Burkholderiales bacterium]
MKLDDKERTRCEIWTRVMGYHRPISSFNIGKQGEFYERKYFTEEKCGYSK